MRIKRRSSNAQSQGLWCRFLHNSMVFGTPVAQLYSVIALRNILRKIFRKKVSRRYINEEEPKMFGMKKNVFQKADLVKQLIANCLGRDCTDRDVLSLLSRASSFDKGVTKSANAIHQEQESKGSFQFINRFI